MDIVSTVYDAELKIWSGPQQTAYYDANTSLGKVIFKTMRTYPKNITQICADDDRTMTNQEALTASIRVAQHYRSLGLGCEDTVCVAASSTTHMFAVTIACYLNATPVLAVTPALGDDPLQHIFALTKPRIIFCDGQHYEKMRLASKSFQSTIYTLSQHIPGVPRVEELLEPTNTERFYKPAVLTKGPDQTVAIVCSSGTSGLNKAICVSNSKLLATVELFTSEDVMFTTSTPDWLSGMYFLLYSAVYGCTRIITSKAFDAQRVVDIIEKYNVTLMLMQPRHVNALVHCPAATPQNMSSLRCLYFTGSVMHLPTLQNAQAIFKNAFLLNLYGITEISGISMNIGQVHDKSVGKLLPGLRVRIVDENGNNLGPNKMGEVLVHDGSTWNGYYGDPVATRSIQDASGWFHTGDLGYINDNGCLFLVDRKTYILCYHDFDYLPLEIEEVIAEIPEVLDVCVVGIEDYYGEAAGALIVKEVGSNLSELEVNDYVAKRLKAFYKELHAGVRFVEKLPYNINGKVIKEKAKEIFSPTLQADLIR